MGVIYFSFTCKIPSSILLLNWDFVELLEIDWVSSVYVEVCNMHALTFHAWPRKPT